MLWVEMEVNLGAEKHMVELTWRDDEACLRDYVITCFVYRSGCHPISGVRVSPWSDQWSFAVPGGAPLKIDETKPQQPAQRATATSL